MSIGLRIKELRNKNNLSQEDFSEIIGIKRASLGHIEAGRQLPTIEMLSKIVRIFSVSYSYLIDGILDKDSFNQSIIGNNNNNNNLTAGDINERNEPYGAHNYDKIIDMLKDQIDKKDVLITKLIDQQNVLINKINELANKQK
ncbi:MAG: helix-turn-helix domain-containing protein [Bacteroidales bacterium]|jgi:transcriptional regulator with XRE-family HTH domain